MTYQDCVVPAQAPEGISGGIDEARLAEANINPRTGFATDYLNHFNEAIMLLEMLSICPDCIEDFLAWRPLSYREHFAASRLKGRVTVIAAYESADGRSRERLDALTASMTAMLEATRAALRSGLPPEAGGLIAQTAAADLRPLIARAGAVINGEADAEPGQASAPQTVIDGLMRRSA